MKVHKLAHFGLLFGHNFEDVVNIMVQTLEYDRKQPILSSAQISIISSFSPYVLQKTPIYHGSTICMSWRANTLAITGRVLVCRPDG